MQQENWHYALDSELFFYLDTEESRISTLTTEDTDFIGLRKLKGVERIPHIIDLVSKSPLFWDIPLGLWVDL